jgi:DtxR family transcriptional regulator, Mn-dependent transcriptional regulator
MKQLLSTEAAPGMTSPRITMSKEDYLKAMVDIELEGDWPIPATLARWLGVSAPAVTNQVARLKRDGLVTVLDDGRLRVTEDGLRIADRIRYRHYLIERMLAEMFGMEWWKVHDEAERLEHAISEEFEELLAARFGVQEACPHGTPFAMESFAARRGQGWIPFDELKVGDDAVVRCFNERSRDLLEYFDQRGLRPNASVRLVAVHSDETASVWIDGREEKFGRAGLSHVWVECRS